MEPTPKTIELNYVPVGLLDPLSSESAGAEVNATPNSNTTPPSPIAYAPYHTHNGTDSPFLQQIRMGSGTNSAHMDPNQGLWMGAEAFASAPFRVDMAGNLVATSATITIATLGGFDIGADYIRDAANSMGLASTVTGGDDVRFWAGATFANRATAPFRAHESGAVTMDNVTITGGSITGAGVVAVVALNLANRGWSQTCSFTVTDADTIAWGSGSFVTADGGTTLSISAGNTGNMAAKTYIYLDAGVSLTAYQVTTTASTAVGASKVLIAIAQNGTGEATFTVMGGMGGQNIDAGNIVANSITANELSTSITYAGAIIIDSSGMIRSGQTAYRTGTGWFIGNVSGTPKLSIGVGGSGPEMFWDGTKIQATNITIVQQLTAGESFTGATTPQPAFIGDDTSYAVFDETGLTFVTYSINLTKKLAQQYIPSQNETVNFIKLKVERDAGMSSDLRVGVQADSSGAPSGTFLASALIANADIQTGSPAIETSALFTSNLELTSGATYWIVCQLETTSETDLCYPQNTDNSPGYTFAYYDGSTWTVDTSGELGIGLFIKHIGGQVFKSDANDSTRAKFQGFVINTVAVGSTATDFLFTGFATTFSGLTSGATYYVSDTRATISTTPGTTTVEVGKAISATQLLIKSY